MVQGTNLQHALMLASRHLDRHPDAEPVVLVVTDGEPTAHLLADGSAVVRLADPRRRRSRLTMAEVDRMTRRDATINVFMLDDERLSGSSRRWPGATAAGCSRRHRTGSASTSSATTCGPAGRRAGSATGRPPGKRGIDFALGLFGRDAAAWIS